MSKTRIKAELILASKNAETGDILYTMRLTYPRIILPEFLTHRVFSRNTSSSRAIPGKKIRRSVINDPFIPSHIGRKQKGMTAGAEITGWRRSLIRGVWAAARYPAVAASWLMEKVGVAKQIANRVLEPWMWITQVVSATDLNNFILLRTHKDAEPHFQELAHGVKDIKDVVDGVLDYFETYDGGMTGQFERIQILQAGEWHLPFLSYDEIENDFYTVEEKKLISAARCARTSYTLIEDGAKPGTAKDRRLGNDLVSAEPLHASPLEHQAEVSNYPLRFANFRGFKQFRYEIAGENGGDK